MRSALMVSFAAALAAQEAQRTTADGVYSLAQAERGRGRYEAVCQSCHAPDLSGGVGSALKGDTFTTNWSGLPLARLFERVRTMPPDSPSPLSDEAAEDLVAYLLSVNGFPAGDPIARGGVEEIRFGSSEAPDAVPNFALVQVFGCIRRGPDGGWLAVNATPPVRTRDPDASPAGGSPRDQPPGGSGTFRLLNAFPSPEKFDGQLAEAKGFLIRGDVDSINVTALSSVAPACR
jgi:mono/diheme cytochrome c family protein